MTKIKAFLKSVCIGYVITAGLGAVLICESGCCNAVPRAISIDPRFSELEQAQIRDAVDQWCAADGWCPDVGVGQEAQAHIWRDDTEQFSRFVDKPGVSGHTDLESFTIHVSGSVLDDWPEMTWLIVAHEMGHLQGLDDDTNPDDSECTMFWKHSTPSSTLTCE